tara:strand:+ start:1084 stop:3111 length:2028 start_codon:yes stop_codon:yes gene_type:complete
MGKGIVKLGEGSWATKDGKLLAAKETNRRFKNAEFTVARGSDATYVGRDGLIKQTSSNIESEVFLNPNFDATISLGNNGSGWSDDGVGEVAFYNGGLKMTTDGSGSAKARARNASLSSGILETSRLYELTYEIKSISSKSNTFSLYVAGNTITITEKSVGTHTILIASGTNANKIFQFQWIQGDSESIVLGNVSLKESLAVNGAFDTDSNWGNTGNNGISISGGKLNFNDTPYATTSTQANVTELEKTYKIVFTVSDYDKGSVRIFLGGAATPSVDANGTYTFYLKASSNTSLGVQVMSGSGTTLSLDNVSVFEIDNGALPRIDFTDNTDGHLLLEPQSRNLVTYSEEFDNNYWNTLTKINLESTSITNPSGANNSFKISATADTQSHYFDHDSFTGAQAGETYTFSVFVKSAGSDFIQIASSSGFPARYQNFNLSTGAKASGDISSATIEAYPNGWYRISVTETTVSTSRRFLIVPVLADVSRNSSFLGDGTSGAYIWGAQLEELPYASSYIPTNGSTVTRDAETCTGAGSSADFNSEEGVLYAEIAALAEDGLRKYISLSDGTTNNDVRLYLDTNGYISALSKVGGSTQVFIQSNAYTQTDFNKVAFKYKVNDFALWINGVEVATDNSGNTNTANSLDELNFNGNGFDFYGKCKAMRVYKEALSDSELTTLTS